jgi:hypothetical protein
LFLHFLSGITQRINDLQTSYNHARDWRRNTGAGILESDLVNGVKTVEGKESIFIDLEGETNFMIHIHRPTPHNLSMVGHP